MSSPGRTTLIYTLSCPESGEVRYVGKTTQQLAERLRGHLRAKRKTRCRSWIESLRRKGIEPKIELIETVSSGDNWQDAERFWIVYLKSLGCRLVNHTDGGEGLHNPDQETRKKLRLNRLGKKQPASAIQLQRMKMLGFRHSETSKKKMSEKRRGRKLTAEQIQAMSQRMTGKKLSPVTKAKMSAAHTGKSASPKQLSALRQGRAKARTDAAIKKMRDTKRRQAANLKTRLV